MKKYFLSFVLLSFISAAAFAQNNVTVGPYLQSPTPNSIKIKWWSSATAIGKVMYGTSIGNLTQTATEASGTNKHTVLITGLSPDTKYYYAIYNDNTKAEGDDANHHFKTFPVAGTNTHIRAWCIGDFGKGNSKQQQVRDSYPFDSVETDLWLWMGDNVYNDGTEQEYLDKVFDSVWGYKSLMKHMPFLPTPGNHDYSSVSPITSPVPPLQQTGPYLDFVDVYTNAEAGGVATGHELFYSYDYGNTHFISFNSELGSIFGSSNDDWIGASLVSSFSSTPQSQWLHADLTANTKPWVVIYFHQPPYTDGSHDAGQFWEVFMQAMRENFAPIWEQYGVDLVICGHSHTYERSYLAKGAYGDAADITPLNIVQNRSGDDATGQAYTKTLVGSNPNQGTVYVVCGNSGSSEGSPGFTHPLMYSEYGCDTCIGSFVLDIDSNRLDGRHLDAYGNIRDQFTIYKTFAPTGVKELESSLFGKLSVAPNPFTQATTVSFELQSNENIKARLSDATGKSIQLFEGNLAKGNQKIEIDAEKLKLEKGVYTLQHTAGTNNITRTIILQ